MVSGFRAHIGRMAGETGLISGACHRSSPGLWHNRFIGFWTVACKAGESKAQGPTPVVAGACIPVSAGVFFLELP
jgi:hypothetical protein